MIKYIYFILSFFLFSLSFCFGQKENNSGYVVFDSVSTKNNIGKDLFIYQDSSNSLLFEDILSSEVQKKFKPSNKRVPDFGINNVTIWVKLKIKNNTEQDLRQYIEIAFPTLDSVFFYQKNVQDSSWQKFFASDRVPFKNRVVKHKNIVFPLKIASQNEKEIYFRIRNKGSIILPINIMPQQTLYKDDLAEEIAYGIFYGIMLVMLVYNLLLAFTARSVTYIYYVGIIAGNLFTLSALNGHAFQYIWGEFPWWANHIIIFGIGLWILSGNLFAASFLDVRRYQRFLFRAFKAMQLLGLVILLSTFLLDYTSSLMIANIGLIFNCFFLLAMGLTFWYLKVRVAGIFSLAWVLYLLGVLLYTLRNLGILPVNIFTTHVLEIGAVSEVLLLSVSLGYKYRLLEIEKNKAQQNSLDLMTRSQEMIQQQNEQLEKRIEERTLQLKKKQNEVVEQNATLNEQNQQLLNAQTIIKDQNKQLQIYNENLELKVSKRTADLKETNHKLAENVQKLEQYAFMTAHNLRAPVARLLGLTQLLEIDPNTDKDEWLNIITMVKEEGKSLDSVINDLNAILELRKNQQQDTEPVNIEEVIQHVKKILKDTIRLHKAKILIDVTELNILDANPTYMESIFYNLISNSIKYSRPENSPVIEIKSYLKRGIKVIEFKDNGIGIDLSKHKENIFGMYKRFHTHVDGKGLGLFLVKSQVEIMGGKIKIDSKLGEGTQFKLLFK